MYKELKEGEESTTANLLRYIAQYGRTKGSGVAIGVGVSNPHPKRHLILLGYIRDLGNSRYEVTEKGWRYLDAEPGVEYYRELSTHPLSEEEKDRYTLLDRFYSTYGRTGVGDETGATPKEQELNEEFLLASLEGEEAKRALWNRRMEERGTLLARAVDARRGYKIERI